MSKHFYVEPFSWIWWQVGELSQRTRLCRHPGLIMYQNTGRIKKTDRLYILWSCIIMGLVKSLVMGNLISWMLSHCHICGSCWPYFLKNCVFKVLCASLLHDTMFDSDIICLKKIDSSVLIWICLIILKNGCWRSTWQANLTYFKNRTYMLKSLFIHIIDSTCFACKLRNSLYPFWEVYSCQLYHSSCVSHPTVFPWLQLDHNFPAAWWLPALPVCCPCCVQWGRCISVELLIRSPFCGDKS